MVAYVDSSAAVKLAHREAHSQALVDWLNSQANLVMVSSVLTEVELRRALFRYDPGALPEVPAVVARINRVEMTADIRSLAAGYAYATLRTLGAIHLATARFTALSMGQALDAFVAYDTRLTDFAQREQFTVFSPGT